MSLTDSSAVFSSFASRSRATWSRLTSPQTRSISALMALSSASVFFASWAGAAGQATASMQSHGHP